MVARFLAFFVVVSAFAQPSRLPVAAVSCGRFVGKYDGAPQGEVVYSDTVYLRGARWMRLSFGEYNLGEGSYLVLRSLLDGGEQRLDAKTLPQWNNLSAYFNGDRVLVELHVAPGDTGVFYTLTTVFRDSAGASGGQSGAKEVVSLCGDDDRVLSDDPRVGRLVPCGCTAWIGSNGALFTAGHCVDDDGNDTIDACFAVGIVEFNVPLSNADGSWNHPPPEDQYPVDTSTVIWENDGDRDWAVFKCSPNSTTGLLPHEAQGSFFRLTDDVPASGAVVRITGYGNDDTPPERDNVQQTSTGPCDGTVVIDGALKVKYVVDTEPGNSGSPVIWETYDISAGIHTNGGCGTVGYNRGTSFSFSPLHDTTANYLGTNVIYVDREHPHVPSETGDIFRPYDGVGEAVDAASSGDIIFILPSNYPASEGNVFSAGDDGKHLILKAPMGAAVIGN